MRVYKHLLQRILAILLCLLSPDGAFADQAAGVNWLATQVRSDGSIVGDADLADNYQATSEALRTFLTLGETGQPGVGPASTYLEAEPYRSTEYLSRLIVIQLDRGQDVSPLVTELRTYANGDGGFGELSGFSSTPLDTAFALEALALVSDPEDPLVQQALGYLLDIQQEDGGWGLDGNGSDLYITTLVMRSLWHYRQYFDLGSVLERAQSFIFNERTGDGAWSETYLSALALIAVLPNLVDASGLQLAVDELQGRQLPDGSFEGDVYVTALALRALHLASSPRPNPDLGSISGQFVDGVSGEPLDGLPVSLEGPQTLSLITGVDGTFLFDGLAPGEYRMTAGLEGYGTINSVIQLNSGRLIDLGVIQLLPVTQPDTVLVHGIVTDGEMGLPLSGVTVSANGESVQTDADGVYTITGLTPGVIRVVATLNGYAAVSGSAEVAAGEVLVFSPQLFHTTSDTSISGVVHDDETGLPLGDVAVVLSGANDADALTGPDGGFEINNLNTGATTVTATLSGYTSATAEVDVQLDQRYDFSPSLLPLAQAQILLEGRVTDATTDLPLPGALVVLGGVNSSEMQADDMGRFRFAGLEPGVTLITVSDEGYVVLEDSILLEAGRGYVYPAGLYPESFEPPTGTVSGRVLVQESGEPVPGAVIEITQGDLEMATVADSDGRFLFEGITAGNWSLVVYRTGFVENRTEFLMPDNVIPLDLGDLPLQTGARLPDLVIEGMDLSLLQSDPISFRTQGTLGITIANVGEAENTTSYDVIAYYDGDLDGTFDAGSDTPLANARVEGVLAPGETSGLILAIDADLPFRDAPIRVWVNSSGEVLESNDRNNDRSTSDLGRCRL